MESYTADSDICSETIRTWRKMQGKPGVLDLKNAYLQLHVREDLYKFQTVSHKANSYVLTCLGFGLNCAPKIMSAVLHKVLSMDLIIEAATDCYIDNVIVNTDMLSLREVVKPLNKYGLQTKSIECNDNACVLGLQLRNVAGASLQWSRGNQLADDIGSTLSRHELFSLCGKIVGHYPVAE